MKKLKAIKNVAIPAACLAMVALALLAVTVAAGPDVDGKFSLVGSAQWVTGGVTPGNKAVDLTSNCGAETYNPTCYNDPTFTFSNLAFTLKNPATLSSITTLSTAYNFGGADCGGGAPRFVIFGNVHSFEGYFGRPPNFTNCYYGWLNTGNLTTDSTTRWVVNNGNTLMTWAQIQTLYGTEAISEIDIVLDSGWFTPRGQDVTIDDFTINNNVLHP